MTSHLYRVLMLHNYYQHAGGEDVSMAAEIQVLRSHGHPVTLMEWHNGSIQSFSAVEKLALFWQTTWNPNTIQPVKTVLQETSANLLHVQNFFPLASPSVYTAARALHVPVVQHLHNFRLGCLNGYLYRQGQVCEACIGRNPWRGVIHQCYRGSWPASLSLWQMLTVHRYRGTWHRDVDAFITPSQFAAEKLVEIGIPADKLHVKPNFIVDPLTDGQILPLPDVPTFVFIGRLSPEKGVLELLTAWQLLHRPDWRLWIVGDGPQRPTLEQFCQEKILHNVQFWGHCSAPEMLNHLQQASVLVVPSCWYETFGRVVIEAFACGRAAIVSNLGAMAELVTDGQTGFCVDYASPQAWAERLRWCGEHRHELEYLGKQARNVYEQGYTPEVNYHQLRTIYDAVLG